MSSVLGRGSEFAASNQHSNYRETLANPAMPGLFVARGAKLMRRREPVAAASLSSVRIDGRERPLSSRATTGWVVPILRAQKRYICPGWRPDDSDSLKDWKMLMAW